jgi:predicted phosphodiesterase
MKIAVLTDIHANFVALQAVSAQIEAWGPDRVFMAGDLVNRGPRPAECLRFVQEKMQSEGWQWVRGNHEDYVISQARKDIPHHGPHFEVHKASYWTYQQLGCDVSALKSMPFKQSLLDPGGHEVRIVHASMRGLRDGIYPETSDTALEAKIKGNSSASPVTPPAVFCVGHTHRPLVRRLDSTLVVNAGSAGLPFDGDTRPAYAQLTYHKGKWNAEIVRVEYDLQAAERDFYTSGYLPDAGPLVELVLVELREARSQLYNWSIRYQDLAWRGEITMDDSVREFRENE